MSAFTELTRCYCSYDTSELFDDSSVKKFTELYPNWHKNIFDCLGKYAATVLLPDDDDNVADPPPVKANKVVLEFDDNGIPILPTEENGKAITLVGCRQTIMRAYMNANYCMPEHRICHSLADSLSFSCCSSSPGLIRAVGPPQEPPRRLLCRGTGARWCGTRRPCPHASRTS